MKVNKHFLLISTILFILFVLFTFVVHKNFLNQFDFNTTVKLQNHSPRILDPVLSVFSLIGSVEIASLFLLVLLFIYHKLNPIFVLANYAFLHAVEILGKFFVTHKGPPFLFFRYDIPFNFPTSYVRPGFSYPSGHAARASFITVILFAFIEESKLGRRTKNIIEICILGFDFVMFFSRVYLGEHWASDVIGGILLGVSLGILVIWISASKKSVLASIFN